MAHVYIGRFQLPHLGHEAVIYRAMQKAEKLVIFIGSSNAKRSDKNPFDYTERLQMMNEIIKNIRKSTGSTTEVHIHPIPDFENDIDWKNTIVQLTCELTGEIEHTLTGSRKPDDESTYYLDLFKSWDVDMMPSVKNSEGYISSTDLRRKYLKEGITEGLPVSDVVLEELKWITLPNKKFHSPEHGAGIVSDYFRHNISIQFTKEVGSLKVNKIVDVDSNFKSIDGTTYTPLPEFQETLVGKYVICFSHNGMFTFKGDVLKEDTDTIYLNNRKLCKDNIWTNITKKDYTILVADSTETKFEVFKE